MGRVQQRRIQQDDTVHITDSANNKTTNRYGAAGEDEGEHSSQSLAPKGWPALWDTQQDGGMGHVLLEV